MAPAMAREQRMMKTAWYRWVYVGASILCALSGCIDANIPIGGGGGISLFPPGAFVIRGRMDEATGMGMDCPVFRAETGINYHLFQTEAVENDVYDAVTTPGAVSRLVVQERSDLEIACQIGTIVEVQDVLELIPASED
jgi:hypothetical protein